MKVIIEREVSGCSECPCLHEISDMGERMYVCSKIGIMHNATYYSIDKINDNCPFKESKQKHMTDEELIERLEELKRQISKDFVCASDKVDNLYYSLINDIKNSMNR